MKFTLLVIVMACASLLSSASADIIMIPGDYPTIQAGINASSEGDTIIALPGRYVENVNFNGRNVLLGSLYIATLDTSYITATIIDGASQGTVVTFESGEVAASVVGFTLTNGSANAGGAVHCINSSPSLVRNLITNNTGGGLYCQNSTSLIFENRIRFNSGSGIELDHSAYPIISGNLIYYNSTFGNGGGIKCSASNASLINNTIVYNDGHSGGGINMTDTSLIFVTNTILWGDLPPEVFLDDDSYLNMTYSDIQGGWSGEGNIDVDPTFCYPAEMNFYLAQDSPCVGSGQNGDNIGALGIGCEHTEVSSDNVMPDEIFITGSYPNPFNPATTIFFNLPQKSHVSLEIYDIIGRKVATLANDYFDYGFHRVKWDATGYSSGSYFYLLTAGDYSRSGKLILAK